MIEKQYIIEKSAQLFKSSGIRTNTMDDIANAVGISKKTLYQNIADKNELIEEVIMLEFSNTKLLTENISKISSNSIEELLRLNALIVNFMNGINPVAVADMHKLYEPIHSKWKNIFRQHFYNIIINSIKNGKKSGIFRDDINEKLITQLHTDKIDQLHEGNSAINSASERAEVIKEMVTYYIRGLVTKQGDIILNKHIKDFNKYLNK